jgi:hypothetical protein
LVDVVENDGAESVEFRGAAWFGAASVADGLDGMDDGRAVALDEFCQLVPAQGHGVRGYRDRYHARVGEMALATAAQDVRGAEAEVQAHHALDE